MALGDVDARNLFDVGKVLVNVGRLLTERGLTVGFLHHANRKAAPGYGKSAEPLELTDIAYSGLEQYVRQFILLSRREKYEADGRHKLFFKFGGSAGQAGLHELDIYEGLVDENFRGRVWEVSMTSWVEAKAAVASEQEEKAKEAKRLKIESCKADVLDAIDALVRDGLPTHQAGLVAKTALRKSEVSNAIESLIQSKTIVPTTVQVRIGSGASRPANGYMRTPIRAEIPTLNFGEKAPYEPSGPSGQNQEPFGWSDGPGHEHGPSGQNPPVRGGCVPDGPMPDGPGDHDERVNGQAENVPMVGRKKKAVPA